MFKKTILFSFFLFFHSALFTEGFSPETRIFTNYGLLEMQELQVGMEAFCLTADGEITTSPIIAIKKEEPAVLYSFYVNGKKYRATGSQLFYCINRQNWVKLCDLDIENDSVIVNYCEVGKVKNRVEDLPPGYAYDKGATSFDQCLDAIPLFPELYEKRYVYIISLKEHHAFFIDGGILCHNLVYAAVPLYLVYGAEFGLIVFNATLGTLVSYAVASTADRIIATLNKPTPKSSDQASPCHKLDQPQDKIVGCGNPPAELEPNNKPGCGNPPAELNETPQKGCGNPDNSNKPLVLSQPIPEPESGIICEGLPIEQAKPTILSCENHGGRKVGETIPADAPPVTIGDITSEGIPFTDKGKGVSTIFVKPDCDKDGLEFDFSRLKPANVHLKINKDGQPVLIGTLPDDRTITARIDSTDGRPTLELQDGNLRIKVRYGPELPKA